MSIKPISPIPIQDPHGVTGPANHSLEHAAPPKLSSLRQGWNAKFQDVPAFPVADARATAAPTATGAAAKPEIPELPALGAMASQAVLAMEGHAELFGVAPGQGDELPAPSGKGPLATEEPLFGPGPKASERPSPPNIPEIPVPSAAGPSPGTIRKREQETLSAMPSAKAPDVSIPLARNQFTPPADLFSEAPPTAAPPATPRVAQTAAPAKAVENPPPPQVAQYTDDDLREALHPIIAPCVDRFLYTPTHGIHTYLEPMLRSTVRRAIAEQIEEASPFREVSGWDKLAWKMRALIGSRTYEDIVFDHTKRYQVEEVFLLRPLTRSLISYASHNPSRHANPSKVQGVVKAIAAKTSDKKTEGESCTKWEGSRNLMIRRGEHSILAAIVHGPSNAILRADLDYALRQAEERFGKNLEEESDIHLQILQPLLEGCLLIQAPAIPH